MQPTKEKRYYSPQFSALASVSVRRYAWALGVPMTEAVDHLVQLLPSLVDPKKICLACRDKSKCSACGFHGSTAAAVS